MKVALIDPSLLASPIYSSRANEPLGLCYLAAVAKALGHQVKIFQLLDGNGKNFLREILSFKPDVCAFSVLTSTLKNSLLLAREIKKKRKCFSIFGGPHPSGDPALVKNREADFAVLGEGETTFSQLLQKIAKQESDFQNVKGIAFLRKSRVIVTEPRERIEDIDALPLPYRAGLPYSQYKRLVSDVPFAKQRFATMITSRGCPFNCSFCVSPLIWQRRLICRSPQNVVREMATLIKKYRINYIRFLDNDFMVNAGHAWAICEAIIKKKIRVSWACFGSLRNVSLALMKKMRQAGCIEIFYGIESLSQKNLDEAGKELALKNTFLGLKKTEQAGLISMGSLLLGYPRETVRDLKKTERVLARLPLDVLQLAFVTPYPGTAMRQKLKPSDLITTDSNQYYSQKPTLKGNLSVRELLYWQKRLYQSFFNSPLYRERIARRTKKHPKLKTAYENIAIFVKDYLLIKPKTG